ncbi:transposase [Candidatus Fermentibacteria bacterium]|nr:transposase [Candidatus Fermentibacteria bacterium]
MNLYDIYSHSLVPSEYTSGDKERRGRITRCGNKTVRSILVEAAWHYRHRPSNARAIRKRSEDLSDRIRQIAWKAQERLHRRYYRLIARGKPQHKACVAVARELAGFVWAISREVERNH